MAEKVIELTSSCRLTLNTFESFAPILELEYTEHACDYWSSNTETTVDIDKEKAAEIIELLKEAYGI